MADPAPRPRGLNDTWGQRTEFDPARSVTRTAMPQSVASKLHYQDKRSAADVAAMPDEEWLPLSRDNLIDRADVMDYMRAYEHYTTTPAKPGA